MPSSDAHVSSSIISYYLANVLLKYNDVLGNLILVYMIAKALLKHVVLYRISFYLCILCLVVKYNIHLHNFLENVKFSLPNLYYN